MPPSACNNKLFSAQRRTSRAKPSSVSGSTQNCAGPPSRMYVGLPKLHSFPTRRSSDLGQRDLVDRRVGGDRRQGCVLHGRQVEARRLDLRSEEHTSELQSPVHLVCRPLRATTSFFPRRGARAARSPPRSPAPPKTVRGRLLACTSASRSSTLSLHDALPISASVIWSIDGLAAIAARAAYCTGVRSKPAASTSDRKSTRLNSSHPSISYAALCVQQQAFFRAEAHEPREALLGLRLHPKLCGAAFSHVRRPPEAPLFPYTTLFRSRPA